MAGEEKATPSQLLENSQTRDGSAENRKRGGCMFGWIGDVF